jgi:hypothetical protein
MAGHRGAFRQVGLFRTARVNDPSPQNLLAKIGRRLLSAPRSPGRACRPPAPPRRSGRTVDKRLLRLPLHAGSRGMRCAARSPCRSPAHGGMATRPESTGYAASHTRSPSSAPVKQLDSPSAIPQSNAQGRRSRARPPRSPRIRRASAQTSAVQAVSPQEREADWSSASERRGRDSNPRTRKPPLRDFQSRSLSQLGHLSGGTEYAIRLPHASGFGIVVWVGHVPLEPKRGTNGWPTTAMRLCARFHSSKG